MHWVFFCEDVLGSLSPAKVSPPSTDLYLMYIYAYMRERMKRGAEC